LNAALVQLDANGDCLYATTVARQIKHDHPGCRLTWWISSRCRNLLANNPHVDEVVSIDLADWTNASRDVIWALANREITRRQTGPEPYDRVWMPQVYPDNFRRFDGTVRPSMFRGYDRPFTVPIDPVICLTDEERSNAEAFARAHGLAGRGLVVLFECSSNSMQSHVTPEFAKEVARLAAGRGVEAVFLLSTMLDLGADLPANVLSAGSLTMRENLALLDHCTHFIGCGSGLTVVASCGAAKPVPLIQVLSSERSVLGSFFHDFEYWKKPADRFIEMSDATPAQVVDCLEACRDGQTAAARPGFHRPVPVTFDFLHSIGEYLIVRGRYLDAAESLAHAFRRYPDRTELRRRAVRDILPLCPLDQSRALPGGRRQLAFVEETFA
jgi:ADP-heptose:LPS heptosyltransferase